MSLTGKGVVVVCRYISYSQNETQSVPGCLHVQRATIGG